jgi:uncharacterized protein VirK/YbjX
MTKEAINNIAKNEITLWEDPVGDDIFSISLRIPIHDLEGDLCLTFYVGLVQIYYMSFTIIDGRIFGIPEPNVIFITRVQGASGQFQLIKRATTKLDDVSPVSMLFTTVQAISKAFGLKNIVGITAKEQVVLSDMEPSDRFMNSYDNFWNSIGAKMINHMAYKLPTGPRRTNQCVVKSNHRCRTKYKRNFKFLVYSQILDTFRQQCLNPSHAEARPAEQRILLQQGICSGD